MKESILTDTLWEQDGLVLFDGKRSIIHRYRKDAVPGTHIIENHDFISFDQGSRSSISKPLLTLLRSLRQHTEQMEQIVIQP